MQCHISLRTGTQSISFLPHMMQPNRNSLQHWASGQAGYLQKPLVPSLSHIIYMHVMNSSTVHPTKQLYINKLHIRHSLLLCCTEARFTRCWRPFVSFVMAYMHASLQNIYWRLPMLHSHSWRSSAWALTSCVSCCLLFNAAV